MLRVLALSASLVLCSAQFVFAETIYEKGNRLEREAAAREKAITGGKVIKGMPLEMAEPKSGDSRAPGPNGDCVYESKPFHNRTTNTCSFTVECKTSLKETKLYHGTCRAISKSTCGEARSNANDCLTPQRLIPPLNEGARNPLEVTPSNKRKSQGTP